MTNTNHFGLARVVIAFFVVYAGVADAQSRLRESFDLQVPFAPSSLVIGTGRQLVYELHITNFASDTLRIVRLQVLGENDATIADFSGDSLGAILGHAGVKLNGTDSRVVSPGSRAIAYFELPLARTSKWMAVTHRLEYESLRSDERERFTVRGGTAFVDTTRLPELGPPLHGGPWAAVYLPSAERGHRRVVYAIDGRARIPGRFAIDWFKVDEQGAMAPAGAMRTSDFFGYGAEVLAVADGDVVATRDGFPEPKSLRDVHRVPIGDATGNYVALRIGKERFAFYEHLRPGILVKPGDHVHKGQVIGALGFTGEASYPHLHFHVSDTNSPLGAEGRPYHLGGYKLLGGFTEAHPFGANAPWVPLTSPLESQSDLPAPDAVVRFP